MRMCVQELSEYREKIIHATVFSCPYSSLACANRLCKQFERRPVYRRFICSADRERKDRKMALMQMDGIEEAVHALIVSFQPFI